MRSNGAQRERLSALDAAFLSLEAPHAPMHVGWAAQFAPRPDGSRPSFEAIRSHIADRLGRAPRYRQRLAEVPLDLGDPIWVDDAEFDIADHVLRVGHGDFERLADEVMSTPLEHDRPLWELWVAEELDNGMIGIVGKAHHCLVDGLAAIELMALLLDPTPDFESGDGEHWVPQSAPRAIEIAVEAIRERAEQALEVVTLPLRYAREPTRLLELPSHARRAAIALVHTARPPAPPSRLNGPMSPLRHLACTDRSLGDIKTIKRSFGTTVNDVLLAAINVEGTRAMLELAALCDRLGGLRRFTYISTAYVAGRHRGPFRENDFDVGQRFRNAYEQSKFEAERLVRAYGERLAVTVVRPSIIVGDSRSGWTPSFNVLYWPTRALARGGFPVLPARRRSPVDVVSVDYVADAVCALAAMPAASGNTYHLTSARDATTIGELLALACEKLDVKPPPLISPRLYTHVLAPLMSLLRPRRRAFLRAAAAYVPYFAVRSEFDDSRARDALAPEIRPAPLAQYYGRIIDYALRTRWGARPMTRASAAVAAELSDRTCAPLARPR